jgi:integrase/recombinase XerD
VVPVQVRVLSLFYAFCERQHHLTSAPIISYDTMRPSDRALMEAFARDRDSLGRSPETKSGQLRCLRAFFAFLRDRDQEPLTAGRKELCAYVDSLHARKLKPGSIAVHVAALHAFYACLVRRGLIEAAPVVEAPRLRKNPPTHVLSVRQVLRILAQPDTRRPLGIRDRAVLELLYSSALRIGELTRLSVSDLDFAGGFVRVRRGKGGKPRTVPVGTAALEWLRRYLGEVRSMYARPSSRDALFLSFWGRPLGAFTVDALVRQVAKSARVPFRVSPHSFRHAAATHLLRGDGKDQRASLLLVRDILGHASTEPTTIYTRIEITDLERELGRHHFRDVAGRKPSATPRRRRRA